MWQCVRVAIFPSGHNHQKSALEAAYLYKGTIMKIYMVVLHITNWSYAKNAIKIRRSFLGCCICYIM